MKYRNRISLLAAGASLMALGLVNPAHATTTVMGYFDTNYTMPDFTNTTAGNFNVPTVSLLVSHEVGQFRFFAEIEDDPVGTSTTPSLERAWGELTLAPFASLKIGKEVMPTLWQQNHYPNIVVPFSRPQMVRNVFKEYTTGLQLYGKDGVGVIYNLWASNNDNVVTQDGTVGGVAVPGRPSLGAKLGWEGKSGDTHVEVAGLASGNNDFGMNYSAYGGEANISVEHMKLWAEYATAALDATHTTWGLYGILSYAFTFGDAELSPYFMYDSFTGGSTDGNGPIASDLGFAQNTARNRFAIGVNYKPLPNIVWKLEYLNSAAWNGTTYVPGTTTPVAVNLPASNQLAGEFVYFFN